jgi:acyl-coenzyme A synthetase/AMP-(fatty) acid ligase
MKRWSFARFSNIYGPTELNQCTYYHLDTPPVGDASIPIGYAWGDTAFKIIDAQDQEVTKGAIGELVVRTATMMKGYWNNPTGTQKSFYKDEIITGAPHIYYRTGDQVQEDEEGRLLFLGRKDHQVKVRGYRIELGEIESVLTSYPGIEETIAMVTSHDDATQKTLISAIVPSQEVCIDLEALKAFCQKKLPVYAIPDTIQVLERFPRTASGKINRKEIEILITP